jgi:nucleotide-binding universal stress UspA family protein
VLSVAPGSAGLLRTIVAAVDFSPASIRAVEAGILAMEEGGTLILTHVPLGVNLSHPVRDTSGAVFGLDVVQAFERLRDELRPLLPPNATLETRQLSGRVAPELLALANSVSADLLTVGVHSRNVVERLFVGSVATKLIHGAPSSVLASPTPMATERFRLELCVTGNASTDEITAWKALLAAASERNAGRQVMLEEDGPDYGSQVQASGFTLRGIDYDPVNRRVDVMLTRDDARVAHLTRTIERVESIGIKSDQDGRDQAIQIVHGKSQTLLFFES